MCGRLIVFLFSFVLGGGLEERVVDGLDFMVIYICFDCYSIWEDFIVFWTLVFLNVRKVVNRMSFLFVIWSEFECLRL